MEIKLEVSAVLNLSSSDDSRALGNSANREI